MFEKALYCTPFYRFRCRKCMATEEFKVSDDKSVKEAISKAEDNGWTYDDESNVMYCPMCS